MWSLASQSDAAVIYYLPTGMEYTIGRKDCDIVISDDQSISRKHAVLSIQAGEISVVDSNSKYGTRVNKKKITSAHILHHKDIVTFGQGISTFKIMHQPLSFCCSNMSVHEKQCVKELVEKLGGQLFSTWLPSCTHLVMTAITVTSKVVSALSNCCPIVSISWLEAAKQCLEQKLVLPLTDSYVPQLVDRNLSKEACSDILLKPSFARRKLFCGKIFYFLDSKQFLQLSYCIRAAGGKTILLPNTTDLTTKILTDKSTLIVHPKCLPYDLQQHVHEYGLRLISESEIGFAILYSSTDYYCNPCISVSQSQLPAQLSQQQSVCNSFFSTQATQASILACNTEEVDTVDEKEMQTNESINTYHLEQQLYIGYDTTDACTQQSNETILALDSCPLTLNSSKRLKNEMNHHINKKPKLHTPPHDTPQCVLNIRNHSEISPVAYNTATATNTQDTENPTSLKQQASFDASKPTYVSIKEHDLVGFISSHKKELKSEVLDKDINLPTSNVIIDTANLVRNFRSDLCEYSTRPNFKRFKKVLHPYYHHSSNTRIIGVNELSAYD